MWIKKLRRRKADPAPDPLRASAAPPVRKNPARPLLWAALAVAALMLTTFVLFGAIGGSMIKAAPPPVYTEGPTAP